MRLRILALVALCACPPLIASAEGDAPPLPDRNPLRPTKPLAAPAVEEKPVLPGEQPTVPWTESEIEAAKAKCKELLTGDPLDYEVLPPIKEGICGTPAPVLLRAVGTDPKVTINPPATLSCPMADVLGEWLRDTVQPEAKKLFGSTVIKIQNASSYVCRNRYGGGTTPLSEHALANALDVSEFVLANGERITVLDAWPKPVVTAPPTPLPNPTREPDTTASATSTPADKSTGRKASKDTSAKAEPVALSSPPPAPLANPARAPKSDKTAGGRPNKVTAAKAEPVGQPAPPAASVPDPDPKALFVTHVHDAACKEFGTTLGPEANAAHKNHFHLDMKARRHSGYCDNGSVRKP
jgi:hypothetical protein